MQLVPVVAIALLVAAAIHHLVNFWGNSKHSSLIEFTASGPELYALSQVAAAEVAC
jgi:hypothetical protein